MTTSAQPHSHPFERKLIQTDCRRRIPGSLHPSRKLPTNYGKLFEQRRSEASRTAEIFAHRRSRGIGPLNKSPYFLNHKRPHKATHMINPGSGLDRLSITVTFPYFFLWKAFHKKKNWLFIGHPDAGQRSAILYSLIVSCERHGKDPLAYLKDLLTRLPRMTNQDDLKPLLPVNWQPLQ